MVENGIFLEGDLPEHWDSHTIDESNEVNGKPFYYWKNRTGGIIPACAGGIILANCADVIIEGYNTSNGTLGIELGFANNNTIRNNDLSSSRFGIRLYSSNDNNISHNKVMSNIDGIVLSGSNNNDIHNNIVSENDMDGIILSGSNNNDIHYNIVSENDKNGISVKDSENNRFFHNTVKNNDQNGFDFYGTWTYLNKIEYNIINSNTGHGINCNWSRENIITSNTITNSSGNGIKLSGSYENIINSNNISNNDNDGLNLNDSSRNNITYNLIASNSLYGISLHGFSHNNEIHHNSFINNQETSQAFDESLRNNWFESHQGNYWSDWLQPDNDGNGIVDNPYVIDGSAESEDRYPLVESPFYIIPAFDMDKSHTIIPDTMIQFDASYGHEHEDMVNYTWSFDYDNEEVTLYGAHAMYHFNKSGYYIINLTMTDRKGNMTYDTLEIIVVPDEERPHETESKIVVPDEEHPHETEPKIYPWLAITGLSFIVTLIGVLLWKFRKTRIH